MDPTRQHVVGWHEAGHAIAADELGAGVDWIERNPDGSGHCHINSNRDVGTLFDQAVIYAAGALAVGFKFGRKYADINGNDRKGLQAVSPERRTKALERASQILRKRWDEVEALAIKLLDDADGFVPIPFPRDFSNP